jgi:inhibitor of growth protein 3
MQWFHYPCVGMSEAPKGKWFCPECTAIRRSNKRLG